MGLGGEVAMSSVRIRTVVPLAGQATLDLSPFDRFGGRGGRLSVKSTGVAAEADGDLTMTVIVGSDILINAGQIQGESSLNRGPDAETPAVVGFGAPADPITITLFNINAAARDVITDVEIENA